MSNSSANTASLAPVLNPNRQRPGKESGRLGLMSAVVIGLLLPVLCGTLAFAQDAIPAVETAPTPAAQEATAEASGLLAIVFSGGPAGIAVMLVLLGLSLTALYLVIDQLLTLRRSELLPAGLGDEVRQALKENRIEDAGTACQENPSMLSFVLLHGIEELPFGWSSVEKSVEEALAEQSAQLYRRAEYLSVIGNIAPMVGLLGTVMGMIMAFHRVAESQGTASASELAEGIYQALITTVGGLIIAIPSLGAFAIFRNRLDQLIAEAAFVAQQVFSPLRKKKAASRSKDS